MGDVWSAVHRVHQVPAAVKLLTADAARDPDFWMAFRNEVRAVAVLDHPNIVCIYDYGEITERESTDGDGLFASGTPWLAMELVEGDTLLACCGRVDWEQTLVVCTGLLDALAHAHARGVYHRDLKPANVLVGNTPRIEAVKLMDFGLAHAAEGTEADHFNGGTPAYMAPEQFDGRWRNYGPWTDLYGLGCLIYALISGTPPYGPTHSFEASRELHKTGTVPPLQSPFPLPAGFESWLRRLLEQDMGRRYRRAADARYDLLQLPPPSTQPVSRMARRSADADTIRLHTLSTLIHNRDLPTEEVSFTVGSSVADPPPLPEDWRGSRGASRSMHAGLNLFGVRKVPLIGRNDERDVLWKALRETRERGTVRVVAIHGPAGVGISRLAEWAGHRAHEVGSAILMRASHAAVAGPRDGLAGMAFRFLRCAGLSGTRLRERIRALVGDNREEGEALLELLAPGTAAVRFQSRSERHFAVEQLLVRATLERPVVLWLDDVHWGSDALHFVQRLLRRGFARPVLVMMTATDEGLAAHTTEHILWEEICGNPQCRTLPLAPLGKRNRLKLVDAVVGLEQGLAERVQEATGGNPQFLVRLLEDWVESGLLLPGPRGFRVEPGVAIPPDLETLLEGRVERILDRYDEDDARSLEVAAVLGQQVVSAEWEAACALLGTGTSSRLVQDLLDGGLASRGEGGFGWSFSHRHLPRYLVSRAEEHERLSACHRVCAEVLALRAGSPGNAARVGAHLLGAEEPARALEPLLEAVREASNAGEYARAERLLAAYERALDDAGLPASDRRRGLALFERHQLHVPQGRMVEAKQTVDRLIAMAETHGWERLKVQGWVVRGRRLRVGGMPEEAQAELDAALAAAAVIEAPDLTAQAQQELGDLFLGIGRLEQGAMHVRQALFGFVDLGDLASQAKCWQSLGELTKEAGDHEEAATLLSKAADLFEGSGHRWGRASALNSLGDTLRHMGRLQESEGLYRQAAGVFRAIGSPSVVYPEYNAALTLVAQGRVHEAMPAIRHAHDWFERLDNMAGLANAQLALAVCAAHAENWLAWDEHLRDCLATRQRSTSTDEDLAWMAEVGAARAREAHQGYRARQAYELALEIWSALDRTGRVDAVRSQLEALKEDARRA